MIGCMNVDEARAECKDRSRWRSIVSAYSHGKNSECMYVCIIKKVMKYWKQDSFLLVIGYIIE